jgi:hypothetical protein
LEDVKKDEVYLNLGQEKKETVINEEEFALETLIDVDASILSPYQKPVQEKEDNKTATEGKISILEPSFTKEGKSSDLISSSEEKNMEVVIASDVKHTRKAEKPLEAEESKKETDIDKTLVDSQEIKPAPIDKIETQEPKESIEIEERNKSEEEFVLEINPKNISDIKEEPNQKSAPISQVETPIEEEMITGDDIVSKIASWDTPHPTTDREKKDTKKEKLTKEYF